MTKFEPSESILKRYADVLVKFALGDWGVKPGEVVYLNIPESAKPLLKQLQISILEAGGHFLTDYVPEGLNKNLFVYGNDDQLGFWPEKYMLAQVETCDHFLRIESSWISNALEGVDPSKIMFRQEKLWFYHNARHSKESRGEMTWTVAVYWTESMAETVGLSYEEYWDQIIKACYLDCEDPVYEWTKTFGEMARIKAVLDWLKIEKIQVVWEHSDISYKIGHDRKWAWGVARNIPTFEIFTSPDWRGTNGWIEFDQPLFVYWSIIRGIKLEFVDWKIVSASADENEALLLSMINVENADKVGEFSLTDNRFSRITKPMWNTLYDENVWGRYWNTHLAIWQSFWFTYAYDEELTWFDLAAKGFNASAIHTDIVSTYDRTAIATLPDWTELVIYENWQFTI